jgi:hypothetical protein
MIDSKYNGAIIEAANRAEVTALLIRCGYQVYRPESDINGEDLVVKSKKGKMRAVQLKGRLTIDESKYLNKNIWMLFPSQVYKFGVKREWFLIPHDILCNYIHDHYTVRSKGRWGCPKVPRDALPFLLRWHLDPDTDSSSN